MPTPESVIKRARELRELSMNKQESDALLHQAALNGQIDIIILLARLGADLSAKNSAGKTAADIAQEQGFTDCHEKLTSLISFNEQNFDEGTFLHRLVINENTDSVKSAIEIGMNINAKNNKGKTPLHLAASLGNTEIIKLLLAAGADMNLLDNSQRAPIHYAIVSCHDDAKDLFIEFGNETQYLGYRERRTLNFIFDHQQVSQLIYQSDHATKYTTGGADVEALLTLKDCLNDFAKIDSDFSRDKDLISIIEHAITENRDEKTNLDNLSQHEIYLSNTGFVGHSIPFTLRKTDDNNFLLSIYERGYFADKRSIRRIPIPKERHKLVLKQLHDSHRKVVEGAKATLFSFIPQAVNSEYIFENINQKFFKGPFCFWSNHKTFILDYYLTKYRNALPHAATESDKKAAELHAIARYKKFDIFCHRWGLDKYQEYCLKYPGLEPYSQVVIEKCRTIIDKLIHKYKNNAELIYVEYQQQLQDFAYFKEHSTVSGTEDDKLPPQVPEDLTRMRQI